jgi:hypothetical protein
MAFGVCSSMKILCAIVSILAGSIPALAAQQTPLMWPVQNAGSWGNYSEARGAHDAEWVIRCQPVIVVDKYGISRNVYAQPGCARFAPY